MKEKKQWLMPSQAELNDLFTCDPETGRVFVRTRRKHANIGDEVGYVVCRILKKRIEKRRFMSLKGRPVGLSRVIWTMVNGDIPAEMEIDHINGNSMDDSITNLRVVTAAENARNAAKPVRNTSGVIGVRFDKERRKWIARISVNSKKVTLGRFEKFEDAVAARVAAEATYGYHPNHGREIIRH